MFGVLGDLHGGGPGAAAVGGAGDPKIAGARGADGGQDGTVLQDGEAGFVAIELDERGIVPGEALVGGAEDPALKLLSAVGEGGFVIDGHEGGAVFELNDFAIGRDRGGDDVLIARGAAGFGLAAAFAPGFAAIGGAHDVDPVKDPVFAGGGLFAIRAIAAQDGIGGEQGAVFQLAEGGVAVVFGRVDKDGGLGPGAALVFRSDPVEPTAAADVGCAAAEDGGEAAVVELDEDGEIAVAVDDNLRGRLRGSEERGGGEKKADLHEVSVASDSRARRRR